MEKHYAKIAEIIELEIDEVPKYSKELEGFDGSYFYNPIRGGVGIIVDKDGFYLGAASSVNLDKHIEEFVERKNNNNLKNLNDN